MTLMSGDGVMGWRWWWGSYLSPHLIFGREIAAVETPKRVNGKKLLNFPVYLVFCHSFVFLDECCGLPDKLYLCCQNDFPESALSFVSLNAQKYSMDITVLSSHGQPGPPSVFVDKVLLELLWSSIFMFSTAAFMLQCQSWVLVTESLWPTKSKIFTI